MLPLSFFLLKCWRNFFLDTVGFLTSSSDVSSERKIWKRLLWYLQNNKTQNIDGTNFGQQHRLTSSSCQYMFWDAASMLWDYYDLRGFLAKYRFQMLWQGVMRGNCNPKQTWNMIRRNTFWQAIGILSQ